MNELIKIENGKIQVPNNVIQEFIAFKKKKEEMDLKEKEFKQALKDKMEELGIKKFIVDGLSATVKEGSTRTTLDSKKLKEELPEVYEAYSKTAEVASSLTLTISD